jgi:hypothetical protein
VEFAQVMPSTSATAQVVATLGDFTRWPRVRRPPAGLRSLQHQASVGGQSMWERNQIGVRGIERFDINVHDVGDGSPSPARSSASHRLIRRP